MADRGGGWRETCNEYTLQMPGWKQMKISQGPISQERAFQVNAELSRLANQDAALDAAMLALADCAVILAERSYVPKFGVTALTAAERVMTALDLIRVSKLPVKVVRSDKRVSTGDRHRLAAVEVEESA